MTEVGRYTVYELELPQYENTETDCISESNCNGTLITLQFENEYLMGKIVKY